MDDPNLDTESLAVSLAGLALVGVVVIVVAARVARPAVDRLAEVDLTAVMNTFSEGYERWMAARAKSLPGKSVRPELN
jgi:hypothetical protein